MAHTLLLSTVALEIQPIAGEVVSGAVDIPNNSPATHIRFRYPFDDASALNPSCNAVFRVQTSQRTGTDSLNKWTEVKRNPGFGAADNELPHEPGSSNAIDGSSTIWRNRYVRVAVTGVGPVNTGVIIELYDGDPGIPHEEP